jgi:hypothetical protein
MNSTNDSNVIEEAQKAIVEFLSRETPPPATEKDQPTDISALFPRENPALDPQTRQNLVHLANAYQRNGPAGLEKKYNELFPEPPK